MKHLSGVVVPDDLKNRNVWFKVLTRDPKDGKLYPCSGGAQEPYNEPTRRKTGTTWKAGRWMPFVQPRVCHRGYHVTNNPKNWQPDIFDPIEVYWAEVRRACDEGTYSDKMAVGSIRLLRPISHEDIIATDADWLSYHQLLPYYDERLLRSSLVLNALRRLGSEQEKLTLFMPASARKNMLSLVRRALLAALRDNRRTVTFGNDGLRAAYENRALMSAYENCAVGSVWELPYRLQQLGILPGGSSCRYAVSWLSDIFDVRDMKQCVAPELLVTKGLPFKLDMKKYRVIAS